VRKFGNNVDDDDGITMLLLLMESRGGSYTQQSNDEGVCGAPIMRCFFVLEFNKNDGNLRGEALLDRPCHPQKRIMPSIASAADC